MVYYGGGGRFEIARGGDDLKFAIAETIAEIFFVQLSIELGKLEGLFQCCRVPHSMKG